MADTTTIDENSHKSKNNNNNINTADDEKKEQKWIFSLHLPFTNQKVIELITTHESPRHQQQQRRVLSSSFDNNNSDDDDDDITGSSLQEKKSLLDISTSDTDDDNDNQDNKANKKCCWKFTSPFVGTTSFQSNILLKLSYRPGWQGIPEYTRTKTIRNLGRYCCGSSGGGGSCCGGDYIPSEEQIWEIYTTQHIVKTTKIILTIRGMGRCHAIQVYLKSMIDENSDIIENVLDGGDDDNNNNIMKPSTPAYATALKLHRERKGGGRGRGSGPQQQQQSNYKRNSNYSYNRFSQSEDSLPPYNNDDDYENDNNNQYIVITFAVPIETEIAYDPPLLWKIDLPRPKYYDIMLDTISVFDGTVNLNGMNTTGSSNETPPSSPSHVYIQGYQSWSFTGSIYKGQPQPQAALPNMFSRAFNLGGEPPTKPTHIFPTTTNTATSSKNKNKNVRAHRKKKKNQYSYQSDFFTCLTTGSDEDIDEIGGPAFICGWLSQHKQYGTIQLDENLQQIEMHASHHAQFVDQRITTDWCYGQIVSPHHYDEEPMVHYLHAVASHNEAKPLQNGPLLTGWCSWYHYYENITQANLRTNFAKLATMKQKVPTNVAVVDDGYMTAWGDWDSFKPNKFTDMGIVSRDIVAHNMRSGLWLAPFACDKHSTIVKKHPEWIIRNDKGKPANSSNCGKFFYGLDATNPHVRNHAFQAVRRAVHDWGFKVLKLDFLYAACLEGNGKYDVSMTRAQAMHLALQTIREAAGPDVFIIGCGCPVGPGVGYVDGMRVSADTGPTWYPAFPLPWWDHSTLPSLRAMIRNSMSRAPMGHRWWHNDPDCLLLGETTSLTDSEVASAASIIAMTCGMMLLSDDLTKVSIPRMRILTKIFPMTGVSAVVLDLHIAKDRGLPSIMRLWCTDKFNSLEDFRKSESFKCDIRDNNYNAEATHFGRQASFGFDKPTEHPNERKRSCIHVAKGLGSWTVISLSNWADKPKVLDIPVIAIQSSPETGWDSNPTKHTSKPAECGYHVFSFWSGRYSWVSLNDENITPVIGVGNSAANNYGPLHRTLGIHETEIFHIRAVTPGVPQYIGSDLHFSCGYEVLSFDATSQENTVQLQLKTELNRVGHVYFYIPTVSTNHVQITVNGKAGRWNQIGSTPREGGPSHCCGIIIRIMVVIHADGSESDGEVSVTF